MTWDGSFFIIVHAEPAEIERESLTFPSIALFAIYMHQVKKKEKIF